MLEKITRLIKYCRNIHEGKTDVPAPFLVANEDQGTLVLNSPKREPRQIVISLPEATLTGDCDNIKGPHTLIIFVLEKGKEQTRTQEQTDCSIWKLSMSCKPCSPNLSTIYAERTSPGHAPY